MATTATAAAVGCLDWIRAEQDYANDRVVFAEVLSSWLLAREEYRSFWETECTEETAVFVRRHVDSKMVYFRLGCQEADTVQRSCVAASRFVFR